MFSPVTTTERPLNVTVIFQVPLVKCNNPIYVWTFLPSGNKGQQAGTSGGGPWHGVGHKVVEGTALAGGSPF